MSEVKETKTTARSKKAPSVRSSASKKTIANTASVMAAQKHDPYDQDAAIPCMSNVVGQLMIVGKKTGTPYKWSELGAIENVLYADLKAEMNNSRSQIVYDPYLIILVPDVYEQNQKIKDLYESLYDLREVENVLLGNDLNEARVLLESASDSRRGHIRTIISDLIAEERLDSRRMIKLIDEVLNTEFEKAI